MLCLRCHSEMQQKPLVGVLVDYCGTCRSFWLDGGELDALRRGEKKDAATLRAEALAERRLAASRLIHYDEHCPRCQQPLTEVHHGHVRLDQCRACHGLFFDYGELEACLRMRDRGANAWLRRLAGLVYPQAFP